MGRGKKAPDSENEGGHEVMAKLSFEEWKLRKDYEQYLAEADEAPAAEASEAEAAE